MATAKKTATKSAKKPATKAATKPVAVKTAPTGSIESRVTSLEKRIEQLEEHDLVTKAGGLYGTTRAKVQESYDENPGLTIVIGLGILVVLLLIIS